MPRTWTAAWQLNKRRQTTVQAEGEAMLYGRGAGDEAFVAPHVGPGQERLAETRALRFALGPHAHWRVPILLMATGPWLRAKLSGTARATPR